MTDKPDKATKPNGYLVYQPDSDPAAYLGPDHYYSRDLRGAKLYRTEGPARRRAGRRSHDRYTAVVLPAWVLCAANVPDAAGVAKALEADGYPELASVFAAIAASRSVLASAELDRESEL